MKTIPKMAGKMDRTSGTAAKSYVKRLPGEMNCHKIHWNIIVGGIFSSYDNVPNDRSKNEE